MKTVREPTVLYNFLGSYNPRWRLTESSDVLRLSTTEATEPGYTLQLSAEQTTRIREMTVITSSLMVSLTVDENDLPMHLVGRKINEREWVGNASVWHDTPAAARSLSRELSFAEQMASEAHSAIMIPDSRGNIQRLNRLCGNYTGLREHDVVSQGVLKLFVSRREAAASRHSNRIFFRSGNAYEVGLWIPTRKGQRLSPFRNRSIHSGSGKNGIFLVYSGTDVTGERHTQEWLHILANTDSIIGLPNHSAIQDSIDHAVNHADNNKAGVVYLDLGNFKGVNGAYGHSFGDQLLRDMSLATLSCLGHNQVLARPDGDELLVLASGTSQSALKAMASRILTRLRLPFRIGLAGVYTSCSISVTLSPEHGSDSTAVIRHADTAMYTAKEGGWG